MHCMTSVITVSSYFTFPYGFSKKPVFLCIVYSTSSVMSGHVGSWLQPGQGNLINLVT